MVKFVTWTKLSRSFSGCCGWRRTRQRRPRKHLAQNVAAVEAAVVTERELVDVVLQVLAADAVVRPVNAAFKLRPKSFDGVGVGTANNIFPACVVDANVFEPKLAGEVIDRQFVRHNLCRGFDVAADVSNSVVGRHVGNDGCADFPAPLDNADNRRLANRPASAQPRSATADVCLVGLNDTTQQVSTAGHKLADFVPHAVRRFVGHAELPLKLFGRDTIFALGKKENGEEPTFEARLAFVKNCPRSRVQLRPAKRAGVATPLGNAVETVGLAAFADMPRVTSAENVVQTGVIVRELGIEIFKVIHGEPFVFWAERTEQAKPLGLLTTRQSRGGIPSLEQHRVARPLLSVSRATDARVGSRWRSLANLFFGVFFLFSCVFFSVSLALTGIFTDGGTLFSGVRGHVAELRQLVFRVGQFVGRFHIFPFVLVSWLTLTVWLYCMT